MLELLQQNSDLISMAASLAMVVIWLIYLQLFWRSYRRQLRASVIIHLGAGSGMDAQCLISNMSAEAIHIEGIILVLTRGDESWRTTVTTAGGASPKTGSMSVPHHEGPLASGGYINIGRLQDLVDRALSNVKEDTEASNRLGFDSFEIWVIADYSAEQNLVFARRGFNVKRHAGRLALQADRMRTQTLNDGKRQRSIKNDLQDHLEKTLTSRGEGD